MPKKNDPPPKDEEHKSPTGMIIVICVMVGLIVLATIDSFTTKYFSRMCSALAAWTMNNAPGSFIVYELIIMTFLVFCLPYGPLGVLSGALFVQKYGKHGIYLAGFSLFITTMLGACICFVLARNNFKNAVQKQIDRSPKLSFLKNLDRLIQNGQGVEMVILIRLAPLPKGPTNYFLGTTSLTWRDFIIGSSIVGLPMSFLDVCIGAGAKSVKKDNPVSIALFVTALVLFIALICFVGSRAKRKLMALDEEDKNDEVDEELAGLKDDINMDDEEEEEDERQPPPNQQTQRSNNRSPEKKKTYNQVNQNDDDGDDDGNSKNSSGGAPSEPINDASKDSVLGNENTETKKSLLDNLDILQVIGKPNAWIHPDPRLNLTMCNDEPGRKVSQVMVQLSSATFSFQVISARAGWPLRVYPRDAKPKFGMHASKSGVLKENEPAGVVCAASDGSVYKGPGHGHNFHIVAEAGDLVTIYVAREMKPEYDEYSSSNESISLTTAQREQINYEVWYEIIESGRPASHAGDGLSYEEENEQRKKSGRKSKLTLEDSSFERYDDAKFVGGDGVDISKSKRASLKN